MTELRLTATMLLILSQSALVRCQGETTGETTAAASSSTTAGKGSTGKGSSTTPAAGGTTQVTTDAGTDVTTEAAASGQTTGQTTAGQTTEDQGTAVTTEPAVTTEGGATTSTRATSTATTGPLVILPAEVVLQACCGKACTSYTSPLELFGLKCCGATPFNLFNEICCNGTVHRRQRANYYYEECCGSEPLAYDQTCCRGSVYDVAGQMCCGARPYNMYDEAQLCCSDTLHALRPNANAACCGQEKYDGGVKEFCCGDKVYQRSLFDSCCVTQTLDQTTGKEVVAGQGFKSSDAFCCDGVRQYASKDKYDLCCYIFDEKTGKWALKPYASKTHCCDYNGVTAKDKDGKCPVK